MIAHLGDHTMPWNCKGQEPGFLRGENWSWKPTNLTQNQSGFIIHTVDGSEIRRSPVEVGSLSTQYFQGFKNIPGGC